jgi:hypothetical protein
MVFQTTLTKYYPSGGSKERVWNITKVVFQTYPQSTTRVTGTTNKNAGLYACSRSATVLIVVFRVQTIGQRANSRHIRRELDIHNEWVKAINQALGATYLDVVLSARSRQGVLR